MPDISITLSNCREELEIVRHLLGRYKEIEEVEKYSKASELISKLLTKIKRGKEVLPIFK